MLKKLLVICVMVISSLKSHDTITEWTQTYQVKYNQIIQVTNGSKKALFCEKQNTMPFTQLIFSWNAMRPEVGYFSFYVQVRNPETKKWGVWHHMADWGANIQRSYVSKNDGFSTFVHVRLEIEEKKVADAFRIKIIPHQNASLSLIYNYSISTSNFNLFQPEKVVPSYLKSVQITGLPLIAQLALEHADNSRICSPVSCTMLVQYIMHQEQDPIAFALQSFDKGLNVYGSWPCNMAHAFEQCKGKIPFFVRRMNDFCQVHQRLVQAMPVVVSVRGTLPGALKPFPHGHLLVIVGWDNETKEVLCHDPAAESNEKVFKRYPIADFLRAWESSYRLAYIAESNH